MDESIRKDKTIISDQRIADLIERLKELKDGGLQNADYNEINRLTTELYESYNPLENNIDIRDGNIRWRVVPGLEPSSTKFEIEIKKDILQDDVQLALNINGDGSAFESHPGSDSFQFRAGVRIKL